MSIGSLATEPAHGYLSESSKRRFTLVAGLLGAVFFLAQFLLPMLVMFLVMMPMVFDSAASMADLDQAGLWKNELWFIERTAKVNWRDPGNSTSLSALRHVSLKDLESAGPAVPLDPSKGGSSGQLLPVGDRLWVIEADRVSYYQNGVLTRLSGAGRAARSSRLFAHQGRPAVILLGAHPSLATLQEEGARAAWTTKDLPLGLPAESGSLRTLQAVESKGGLYLFAELCTDDPDRCSISYREPDQGAWLPLVEDSCSCATWTALPSESLPTVVLSERAETRETLSVITLTAAGPQRKPVALPKERSAWGGWRALSSEGHLVLLTQGMPGSLSLLEVADGRVVRSVRKKGSFPFGPNMMLFMLIPQLLPILLSLLLALLLTAQMRRHRVQDYIFAGTRRTFASLWQRALAQLVDLVPLSAAFLIPSAWMWRMFSDPESFVESGPMFPFVFVGLFVGAFLCALLVLLAYSYFEGRSGRTPGKWLLGIRVLGTNLQPCGFGRALLRNMLSFVDGFFSFLVGALLVALTENWQRLGDMAARTIVVVDEKPA